MIECSAFVPPDSGPEEAFCAVFVAISKIWFERFAPCKIFDISQL